MEDALTMSMRRSRAVASVAHDRALQLKADGFLPELFDGPNLGFFGGQQSQRKSSEGYSAYRGWLYSAVHTLASKAAGQPVNVGRMVVPGSGGPKSSKYVGGLPIRLRSKSASQEMETLIDHPLLSILEHPNPYQHRWQFVNSFVASLNLTGWSYIVGGDNGDGGVEFYTLPTTWVRPNADFTKFRIADPAKEGFSEGKELGRENVSFAYLPDPENPRRAISPATSQLPAIRIDDKIQSSQIQFFDNAVFPSVLITVGAKPLGNHGPVRPVLTPAQRRQIHLAIDRNWRGVSNYGRPAILDGLIERIDRFGATQPEIGWDKSEDKVKQRILSSFGIHPFILGEQMAGSYAQAYVMQSLFYDKVNTHLDMLDVVMGKFVDTLFPDEKLEVWWTPAEATDPSIENKTWQFARKNGDVSQNEFRERMGLPADEDRNEANISGPAVSQVIALLNSLGNEKTTPDQAAATLIEMGLSTSSAERIAGLASVQVTLGQAVEELGRAVDELKRPIGLLECHEGNVVDV